MGIFLAAEASLYAAFLLLDITGAAPSASDLIKYASVALCFLWRLGKKDPVLTAAQGFVLVADCFLLFTDRFAPGIFAFLAVHLCYRLFLTRREKRSRGVLIWAFCMAAAFLLIAAAKMDAVTVLAVFYAAFLLWNAASALRRGGRLFAAGLLLLIFCDVNVALWNLPSPPIPAALRLFAGFAMWFFYLPSQVFVAFAADRREKCPPDRSQNGPI